MRDEHGIPTWTWWSAAVVGVIAGVAIAVIRAGSPEYPAP
jgi:hypothetical protein